MNTSSRQQTSKDPPTNWMQYRRCSHHLLSGAGCTRGETVGEGRGHIRAGTVWIWPAPACNRSSLLFFELREEKPMEERTRGRRPRRRRP
jgi:hypothetical protein